VQQRECVLRVDQGSDRAKVDSSSALGRDTEFKHRQARKRQKQVTDGERAYWRGEILKLLGKHYLFISDYFFCREG
jgi:hypothetical protein